MSNALITKYFEENGELKKFEIFRDDEPTNCRTDWDNGDVLCVWWNRYCLGDNEGKGTPHETLSELVTDLIDREIDTDELTENEMMVMLQTKATDKIVILPVFIYEHSGLAISCSHSYPFNDRWDSGMAGFIYTTRETVKVTGTPWEQVREMMIEDVETYNMYLQGDVYGYSVEDGEDSCWGFYSDKWGNDLFEELASEAVLKDVKFYEESEVEVKVTVTETRKLKTA